MAFPLPAAPAATAISARALLLAAAVAATTAHAQSQAAKRRLRGRLLPDPGELVHVQKTTARFFDVPQVWSARGVLQTTLTVQIAEMRFGQCPVRMRSYNGQTVGPTLRARPGEKLLIALLDWPAGGGTPPQTAERQCSNSGRWAQNGRAFWAFSDIEAAQLQQFAEDGRNTP